MKQSLLGLFAILGFGVGLLGRSDGLLGPSGSLLELSNGLLTAIGLRRRFSLGKEVLRIPCGTKLSKTAGLHTLSAKDVA